MEHVPQPAANVTPDDAHDKIANQAKAGALQDFSGQPASDHADTQRDNQSLLHWIPSPRKLAPADSPDMMTMVEMVEIAAFMRSARQSGSVRAEGAARHTCQFETEPLADNGPHRCHIGWRSHNRPQQRGDQIRHRRKRDRHEQKCGRTVPAVIACEIAFECRNLASRWTAVGWLASASLPAVHTLTKSLAKAWPASSISQYR